MKFQNLFPIIVLNLLAFSSLGQWNTNTTINTTVAVVAKSQQNTHCVTDKKNGAIIGWDDNRNSSTNSTDIYAQRLNSAGFAKWTANGVAVCIDTNTQRSVAVTEDGNGGVILTWEDNRSGNYDIYAQKIDSSGNAMWTANGVVICNSSTNQKNPKVISDNAGGAIIVWEDSVNFYFDIYAQRINSAGTVAWTTNGVPVCAAPNIQNNPRLDVDGAGGAIITWQDKRSNIDYDIYAQRIDGTGIIYWAIDGVVVCNAANTQNNPRIEPDGSNGAVIAWIDKRIGTDYDIYTQRLNSSGLAQWAANGIAVCSSTGNQSAIDIKYLGSNGVGMSWKDQRSGSHAIYSQIISLAGTAIMPLNGVKVSNSLKSLNPKNIADGSNGVIVAWEDSTAGGWNITSQKIDASGILQWATGGVTVSNAIDDQISVSHAADGSGGAIYVWEDHRNTTDYDVFAQHLFFDGNTMIGIKEFNASSSQISFYPNPVSRLACVKLKNEQTGNFKMTIYNSTGLMVKEEEILSTSYLSLDLGNFESGIYHYTIFDKEKNSVYTGTFILEK
jgi:hypothetical protein